MNTTVHVRDEIAMRGVAQALARLACDGDCILLRGELGAGKTTFARFFIHALQDKAEEVVSPTFTLVQSYVLKDGGTLSHFDLYRLKSAQEAREIGLEEALSSGITLVEWPELLQGSWPDGALDLHILQTAGEARALTLSGGAWQNRLASLFPLSAAG